MSITVVKEGTILRVLHSSEPIPDGQRLVLFSAEELQGVDRERRGWLDVQMPAFIRGDEDEVAEQLFLIPCSGT